MKRAHPGLLTLGYGGEPSQFFFFTLYVIDRYTEYLSYGYSHFEINYVLTEYLNYTEEILSE